MRATLRKMTAKARRAAFAVGAALALTAGQTLFLAPSASADLHVVEVVNWGALNFYDYGEHLYVYDAAKDGYSVRVNLAWDNGSATCTNSSGLGTTKHCNLSIPEGKTIIVTMWQYDKPTGKRGDGVGPYYTPS
ncbi:hypothetical protein ABZ639_09290 [Saccharomonospora sp. NPDC006951]